MKQTETMNKFDLSGRVCLITGGIGLLGQRHRGAIRDAGGIPVTLDIVGEPDFLVDITDKKALEETREKILEKYGRIDTLINNAANNPKMESTQAGKNWTRFENFPEKVWQEDLDVGLKGAFLCSQVFGSYMASQGRGVILNISSDLGLIAPDQRIYRKEGLSEEQQMVKPVTYSLVKHGLIGLTRYLATYWAEKGVRVNALCPGGILNGQDEDFVKRLSNLIPMERMANKDEYQAVVIFLLSDASSYMTGSVLAIDGGRTCW
ncbi:MAG: oxidoreductase [Candidatus Wildermuthbacteria bacterium RIFCSPLOWO2_02_FULL_47_9c]|uniref:Short-chain dehydrogenase/reductase SDR n=2 Tax=Parcubacteria group TaxID=1794811 RepID=A0A837IPE8_9BACT|nr:MAG: Short-chain dehydrogenase/reductase SDR [Candidatus Yanofskybacteria bacterium GW2011_GWC1_48_11]KKW04093.1 MAG: Short-chain dehydrogenase/reductase SDR [Parcubacteria group bacterium GW2011_GWB1_49_12]KKW08805.1 MAG: Short-chain dehydrogenase/reductase SDR [Parcubacteria group bacterium GW2011_GWA1_49_26]KKW14298.1 MAG: Short-chain dehydrogenase/reductase SDR [Parcubacteria group bacterium GW2011_GWA2_50_10]OHA61732.1 MAG: oxidoreductase [Candidatus Wildermuthbacteria bacterium GWA1_49